MSANYVQFGRPVTLNSNQLNREHIRRLELENIVAGRVPRPWMSKPYDREPRRATTEVYAGNPDWTGPRWIVTKAK